MIDIHDRHFIQANACTYYSLHLMGSNTAGMNAITVKGPKQLRNVALQIPPHDTMPNCPSFYALSTRRQTSLLAGHEAYTVSTERPSVS